MKDDNDKHKTMMAIEKWTILLEDQPLSDHQSKHVCEACDATLFNIADTSAGRKDLCFEASDEGQAVHAVRCGALKSRIGVLGDTTRTIGR